MSEVQETLFGIIAKEAGIERDKITLPDRDPNFDTESVKGLVDAVERLVAEKQAAPAAPPTQG